MFISFLKFASRIFKATHSLLLFLDSPGGTEVVSKVKPPCPFASFCRAVFKKKNWANVPAVVV